MKNPQNPRRNPDRIEHTAGRYYERFLLAFYLKDPLCQVRSCVCVRERGDIYGRHDDGMIGPHLRLLGQQPLKRQQVSMATFFSPSHRCHVQLLAHPLAWVGSSRSPGAGGACSKTWVTSREKLFLQIRAQQYNTQIGLVWTLDTQFHTRITRIEVQMN